MDRGCGRPVIAAGVLNLTTDLASLAQTIRDCWCADTAWAPATWRAENPAAGQCWSTAFVVRHFLGGHIVHAEVMPATAPKLYHAWNRLPDGRDIDLTREQFPPGQVLRECDFPEDVIQKVAGSQAERLLLRVKSVLAASAGTPVSG